MNEATKSKTTEDVFVALAVILMLSLSLWDATVMLVGSVVGLAAYLLIFNNRLLRHGWLTAAISIGVSAGLAAAIAMAISLT